MWMMDINKWKAEIVKEKKVTDTLGCFMGRCEASLGDSRIIGDYADGDYQVFGNFQASSHHINNITNVYVCINTSSFNKLK